MKDQTFESEFLTSASFLRVDGRSLVTIIGRDDFFSFFLYRKSLFFRLKFKFSQFDF